MYFLKANCYFSFIIYINAVFYINYTPYPQNPRGWEYHY